jgi:hypothetical protein
METLKIIETWVSVRSSGNGDIAEWPLLLFIAAPPPVLTSERFELTWFYRASFYYSVSFGKHLFSDLSWAAFRPLSRSNLQPTVALAARSPGSKRRDSNPVRTYDARREPSNADGTMFETL